MKSTNRSICVMRDKKTTDLDGVDSSIGGWVVPRQYDTSMYVYNIDLHVATKRTPTG